VNAVVQARYLRGKSSRMEKGQVNLVTIVIIVLVVLGVIFLITRL
jgi:ABC-type lipoprotein release transport system permease subunit